MQESTGRGDLACSRNPLAGGSAGRRVIVASQGDGEESVNSLGDGRATTNTKPDSYGNDLVFDSVALVYQPGKPGWRHPKPVCHQWLSMSQPGSLRTPRNRLSIVIRSGS